MSRFLVAWGRFCLLLVIALLAARPAAAREPERAGALSKYVKAADPSYQFVKRREGRLGNASYIELTLTSQTWHDVVWRHQLFILKPDDTSGASQGLLLIGGGAWRDQYAKPPADDEKLPKEATILAALAAETKGPVAVLLQVPQQPMFGGMVEDQIISYTFEQYLRSGDSTWPLLLPMVKSAVRAMDTVQTVAQSEWKLNVEHFTVTGASKRGWTTWLTGAVDPRVNAIAPMVIDMLNMGPQMKHQVETWGTFSEQIADYTRRGIQQHMNSPQGHALQSIVDPYEYRQLIEQPKLILLGTNDRYWPLDSLNLYWNDLKGEKYVLYIPNNPHGLKDYPRIVGAVAALHQHARGKLALPKLDWQIKEDDAGLALEVRSDLPPKTVRAWTAAAPTLDFRDATWSSTEVPATDGVYRYRLARPEKGDAAVYAELEYAGQNLPYSFSTNVKLVGAKKK